MQERYGVKYAMQYKEFLDKSIATNKKNHGGVLNLSLPEQRKESEEAFVKKYGAKIGFVEELQEKARKSCNENLGVDYPFQSNETHKKIKAGNSKKYGNEVFIASDTGKKRMMELYGVEHAMHYPEFVSKAHQTAFSSKDYTFPSGNVVRVQGYEPFALDELLKQGIREKDILTGAENVPVINYAFGGKQRMYYPDIYIKSKDLLIEVKSLYTYNRDYGQNQAKFAAAEKEHNFELWVYDQKGDRILWRTKKFEMTFMKE